MSVYQGITATAYYNTQFNSINLPKNVSVLSASTSRTKNFAVMEINQLYFLDRVRLKVQGEKDVMGIDYLKLTRSDPTDLPSGIHGQVFYSVQSYTMTSYDVAELYITMDSWLTAGGLDGISACLDGVATRATFPAYGVNTITDPMLIPHFPILAFVGSDGEDIDNGIMLRQDGGTSVIVSTIDLKWLDDQKNHPENVVKFAKELVHEQQAAQQVTVGVLSKALIYCAAQGAACKLYTGTGLYGDSSHQEVETGSSDLRYFYPASVRDGIDYLRSFGLENSIIKSYKLPASCLITDDVDSEHVVGQRIFKIEASSTEIGLAAANADEYKIDYTSSQGYRDAIRNIPLEHAPKYIKTLLGPYNKYVLGSPATGNTRSVLPEELDIIDITNPNFRDAGPVVYVLSDPRPDGRAYFNIRTKDSNYIFENGVVGAGWENNPIVYKDPSGEFLNQMAFESQQEYKDYVSSVEYHKQYNQNPISRAGSNFLKGATNLWYSTGVPNNFGRDMNTLNNAIAGTRVGSGLGFEAKGYVPRTAEDSLADWGIAGYKNQAVRKVQAAQEREQFMISSAVYTPTIRFASSGSLATVTGNGAMLVKFGLDPRDISMFDRIQEQFGIATSEPLTMSMLDPGSNDFAYVEAKGATFKFSSKDVTKDMENDINSLFNTGVRIWSKSPDVTSYNPYRGND